MNIDDSEISITEFRKYVNSLNAKPKRKVKQYYAPIKIGRNEPCLCGSGKKYKRCCL